MFPKNPRFIYAVNRVRADLGPERVAEVQALREAAEAERREEQERKEKNAERYFKRGERARRRGVYGEAVQSLEGAVRLQPGNVEYQEALTDARARLRSETTQSRSAGPAPSRTEPAPKATPEASAGGFQLDFDVRPRHVLLAVLASAALVYAALGAEQVEYPDVAAGNASAEFVRLQSDGRMWSGQVDEPLMPLTGRARAARCAAMVGSLPNAKALIVTGSDGGVAVCGPQ